MLGPVPSTDQGAIHLVFAQWPAAGLRFLLHKPRPWLTEVDLQEVQWWCEFFHHLHGISCRHVAGLPRLPLLFDHALSVSSMIQVCRVQYSWICASPVIILAHSPWYVPKNHLKNPSKYYIYIYMCVCVCIYLTIWIWYSHTCG